MTNNFCWAGPDWYIESWAFGPGWYVVIWSPGDIIILGIITYMSYASIVVIAWKSGLTPRVISITEKPEFTEVAE